MIRRTGNRIKYSLTAQVSLWVVGFAVVLFVAALLVMSHYARQGIYREAMEKAQQTLRTTELRIDNTLNEVETAARSMHWYVEHHLDQPELMDSLCRQMLLSNPHLQGCAVAFEPGMYPQYGTYHEVYAYRSHHDTTRICVAVNSGRQPYTRQKWYFMPLHLDAPTWIDPYVDDAEGEQSFVTSFGMPLHDSRGEVVGVLSADISMQWFADLVLSMRPFPNSHATVMSSDGHLIIHPDSTLHDHEAYFAQANTDVTSEGHLAVISMKTGHGGHCRIHVDGVPSFIFYHPFENTGWSVAIVCPESDVFGAYRTLQHYTLLISLTGLLLIVLFCLYVCHRQLLPLQYLADAARRMAQGHYDEPVRESRRTDEVGYVQNTFRQMQQSISTHIAQISHHTELQRRHNDSLRLAYEQAREADRMKDAVILNMSDHMEQSVKAIKTIVDDFSQRATTMDAEAYNGMADEIQVHTDRTTELLGRLLDIADRKETAG